jgi:hypothetical protein
VNQAPAAPAGQPPSFRLRLVFFKKNSESTSKLGRRRRRLLNAKSRILATAEPAASPSPVSASLSLAQCQWPAATRRPRAGPPLTLALITYITGSLRQLPSSRACTAVCTAGLKRPWGHPSKQPGGLGHWRLHTRQITCPVCRGAGAAFTSQPRSTDRARRHGMAWHGRHGKSRSLG